MEATVPELGPVHFKSRSFLVLIEIFNVGGSARPKRSPETAIFTSGKSSKCNGRHHAFGSVSSSETRSTTSEVEF